MANLRFCTDLRDPERKAALDVGKGALGQCRQFVQCRDPGADDPAKIYASLEAWGKALA